METLPLFPLGTVLCPDGVLSLQIFEVRYLEMIRQCIANDSGFGVVGLTQGSEVRTPEGGESFVHIGTIAHVRLSESPMPALIHVRCTGTQRFRLHGFEQGKYGLWMGQAERLADDAVVAIPAALQDAANALGRLIASWQKDGVSPTAMPLDPPYRLDEAGWVANRWCELLPMPITDKADLLAENDPVDRLQSVRDVLAQRGLLPDE